MVEVTFQIIFRLEMYQNNIFFIFKKLFLTKSNQNDLKIYIKIILKNIYIFRDII